MTETTDNPTNGLPPEKFCRQCLKSALDDLARQPEGLNIVVHYCQTTRRALSLRSYDSVIEAADLLGPGDEDELLAQAKFYWNEWLEIAQRKNAKVEFANHDGRVH